MTVDISLLNGLVQTHNKKYLPTQQSKNVSATQCLGSISYYRSTKPIGSNTYLGLMRIKNVNRCIQWQKNRMDFHSNRRRNLSFLCRTGLFGVPPGKAGEDRPLGSRRVCYSAKMPAHREASINPSMQAISPMRSPAT